MKQGLIYISMVMLTSLAISQTMNVYKNDHSTLNIQMSQIDSITFSVISTPADSSLLLVFTSDSGEASHVYSSRIDGAGIHQLTFGLSKDWGPRINPAKTKIIFESDRSGSNRYYVMNLDGSNQQMITTNGYPGWADWTREGEIIYSNGPSLFKANADGTNPVSIASAPSGTDFTEIACSHTADLIAVTAIGGWGYDRTIYLLNTDGTNMRMLVPNDPGVTFNGSFTPDGTRLAYSHDISQHEEASGQSWDDHIFTINLDGTGKVDLSANKPNNSDDCYLTFTPDGQKIIFEYFPDLVTHIPDLWIMNLDGSGRTKIITNGSGPNVR